LLVRYKTILGCDVDLPLFIRRKVESGQPTITVKEVRMETDLENIEGMFKNRTADVDLARLNRRRIEERFQ